MQTTPGVEEVLRIFFSDTETSRQRGMEYLRRRSARVQDQDKPTNWQVRDAQYDAIVEWGIPEPSKLARLAGIRQPTLVANGDNDTMIPTINTHILEASAYRMRESACIPTQDTDSCSSGRPSSRTW